MKYVFLCRFVKIHLFLFSFFRLDRFRHKLYRLSGLILRPSTSDFFCVCVCYEGGDDLIIFLICFRLLSFPSFFGWIGFVLYNICFVVSFVSFDD